MNIFRLVALLASAVLSSTVALALTATPAQAQATRTWVSGVGDDVNPCSRTAPCKTFAGAISKTSAGGEINCLDPGGYGAVTITKSITIDCEDTQGSILASATNGVNVNDSASGFANTIRVVLRGLSINGAQTAAQNASGNPGSGLAGVNFISGASLTIEDCIIQNFNAGTASGVRIAPGGAAVVSIINSHIINNGTALAGGGVVIQPTGASGSARVFLDNVQVLRNANAALSVNTTGNTAPAGVQVSVTGSDFTGSTFGIALTAPAGTTTATAAINDSFVYNNSSQGIVGNGATVRMRVADTFITGNGTGVNPGGASVINDLGHNVLAGNTTEGTFN